jgi:type III restriction enzyme
MTTATIIPYDKALPEIPGRTPYTRPDQYLEKLGAGDYAVRQGRRSSDMFLVNKLRATVDRWRDEGYQGASEVSKRLMQFWFDQDHLLKACPERSRRDGSVFRYWWAQREALETLIYLTEVRGFQDLAPVIAEFGETPKHGMLEMPFQIETDMEGNRRLRRYVSEVQKDATQDLPEKNLLRYAFKMATGSGKTVVMAMVIVWSYFNRRLGSDLRSLPDFRGLRVFADNFLIVAPNVIVFERLEKDFASNRIFHDLPLSPPEWRAQWDMKVILRGESAQPAPRGNLFLVNIQQIYESKADDWTPTHALDAILGRPPKQDLAAYQPSMLERIKRLPNLMVLNDEAHHVHDDDLAWNQTLLVLHDNLKRKPALSMVEGTGHGLTLWLDFSATPKTQVGTYYPWIIVDYPLAQAIEDQVVKAPLIVHRVDKRDPQTVTRDTVVQAYHDWIVVALDRWKEHTRICKGVGQKPVLFIMTERTAYAEAIAEHIRRHTRLKRNEVLVIHTDAQGRISESIATKQAREILEALRAAARDVDRPDNDIKIIVSVLMLKEGWDVCNVSIILGLRPFTAKAGILPEQAIGRGLRLMQGISPDRRQTLEVIGTDAFEEFVRELEQEGVGIDTVGTPPPAPVWVYPVQEKLAYDIAIPLTRPRYSHEYKNLNQLDPLSLQPIYEADVLAEEMAIEIEMTFATTGTPVHAEVITPEHPLMSQEFLADITNAIAGRIALTGHFAQLYAIVKRYVQQRCFGVEVDLESEAIRRRLRDPMLQEGVVAFLSRRIAQLATQEREIEFEEPGFKLSQTDRFTWRRQHLECRRTVFNLVAIYNDLEARFARFLDNAPDIERFASLAESYTRFRVDYLSTTGAIKFYYPDFVAVQKTRDGAINWIIETKGREYEEVQHKDESIDDWCQKISAQTGQTWRYLKVPQAVFDRGGFESFEELVQRRRTLFEARC